MTTSSTTTPLPLPVTCGAAIESASRNPSRSASPCGGRESTERSSAWQEVFGDGYQSPHAAAKPATEGHSRRPSGDPAAPQAPVAPRSASRTRQTLTQELSRARQVSPQTPAAELARFMDHTLLDATATAEEISRLCDEARENGFASVCVNPARVALCAEKLKGSDVKIVTVVGFPLGATSLETKEAETKQAVADGADEIDMVINIGALRDKDADLVTGEIAAVVKAAEGRAVKVTLQAGLLTHQEKVLACDLAKKAGAAYVKTSTSSDGGVAITDDVRLMRQSVSPGMGVKAAGGIRSAKQARELLMAGACRIGASGAVAIVRSEEK